MRITTNKCPVHPRYYMKVETVEVDWCDCCDGPDSYEREYCPICRRQEARKQERFRKERCHAVMLWQDYIPNAHFINSTMEMWVLPRGPRTQKLASGTRVAIDGSSGYITPNNDAPLVVYI